jgi:hypothetical protein
MSTFDRAGAEALKARIEAYWREQGFEVCVVLAPAGFAPALRGARFDIRSDLINGWPKTKTARPAVTR